MNKAGLMFSFLMLGIMCSSVNAQDWANWRGPEQNGISRETNLPDSWDLETKENVAWVSDIGGRATPIILDGKVYLNCRTHHDFNDPEEKIHLQEQVVCWDLETGKVLWQDKFNVFQTDIPAPRVGWAAMCGDKETGNVFVHSVSGLFRCYSPDGKVVWEHSMLEKFGKISGYGGRTQTPIIDEDRVIVSYLAANWGETKGPAPKHYYYAFDKRTGELQWVNAPGGQPQDTNYSVPTVAVINGQRMLIGGNSDGGVYAMNARTGEKIWGFQMSRRGLNASAAVEGNLVFISHGEDNIDNTEFGRIQCIDGSKTGDITESGSVWRVDGIKAGYTGLLAKDGVLYVVADTGNMYAYDTKTGKPLWDHNLGTVGKGSPVWADGKIYVMEVNGQIHILKPSREGCETLNTVKLKATQVDGLDEIYASPAISKGHVVFVTRDRTICIRDKSKEANVGTVKPLPPETPAGSDVALIQLRPYEVVLKPGTTQKFEVHTFDKNGRFLGKMNPRNLTVDDSLNQLKVNGGEVSTGETTSDAAGTLTTTFGDLTAKARIRTFNSANTWTWDFEGMKGVAVPPQWLRAFAKFKPREIDGNTAMFFGGIGTGKGRPSHATFMGTPDMKDYVIQADVLMKEQRRQLPSIGVIANRYNLILKGNKGQVQVQSWAPHLRMAETVKFRSDPDIWYTMKFKVDASGEEAKLFGKVWKKSESEPDDWTITATDPHPNKSGSPGLYVYATADCLFDNVKVTFEKE